MTVRKITKHNCAVVELDHMEIKAIADALNKAIGKNVGRYCWNQLLKVCFSVLNSILHDEPLHATLYFEDGTERFLTDNDKNEIIKTWDCEVD